MQEPKEDKDEEWCKKINEMVRIRRKACSSIQYRFENMFCFSQLNHPPTPGFGDDNNSSGGLNLIKYY